jgi:hypothetical protein
MQTMDETLPNGLFREALQAMDETLSDGML